MKILKNYKILTVFLVMQWAFIKLIAQYPSKIENFYSNGIYNIISAILQFVFGWIPFSIGDLIYILIGILIVVEVSNLFRRKIGVKKFIFKSFAFLSVLFFVFNFNWALNYFRIPINEKIGFENNSYSETDLIKTTEILINKTNNIHNQLVNNNSLLFTTNLTKKEIRANVNNVYTNFYKTYPISEERNYTIKKSLFSLPLTYMGFAGYLNPFTNEAQINHLIPVNNYPATVSHEIAHQAGIAPESEANFIGFLACSTSANKTFKYSGYILALRYCLNELRFTNKIVYHNLLAKINSGIIKDYERSAAFWQLYQNRSEKYFKWFYDSFLKLNQQEEGIESYNKMVPLLINYYKYK